MAVYASFVILSALLLWAVIFARGPWALKLCLICTVPAFGLIVWHSLESYKGWPAGVSPPQDAALVAEFVDEPKAIYLWMVPPGASRPRAYRIAYTRQAHEEVVVASEARKQGRRVGFRRNQGRYEAYELPPFLPSKETDETP